MKTGMDMKTGMQLESAEPGTIVDTTHVVLEVKTDLLSPRIFFCNVRYTIAVKFIHLMHNLRLRDAQTYQTNTCCAPSFGLDYQIVHDWS